MAYSDLEKHDRKVAHDALEKLHIDEFRPILLALPKIMKTFEDLNLDAAAPGARQAVYAAIGETHDPIAKWKKHNLAVEVDLKKAIAKLAD